MKRFRGGLVFKAHRLLYYSTLGSRVITKKKRFGIQGLGLLVWGLGMRMQGLWCRVQGPGFRVQGLGFRVQGSGFRV